MVHDHLNHDIHKNMRQNQCKVCRRTGEKLFLKGDKCSSPKCPLLKKPYPPGKSPKKQVIPVLSEYGKELRESKKIRSIYAIQERQFKNIVKEVIKRMEKENASKLLIKKLEKKLYNVIYRVGLAKSRKAAKQLVSHGHFLLNGKRVDIPSIEVKIGDEIEIREGSKKRDYFKKIMMIKKDQKIPSWLSYDPQKGKIKVVSEPETEEIERQIDVPLILSFYSR